MSKFYKTQWFGRAAEFPNSEAPKDEFYEGIRRINDKERIAVEKYMSQEFDYDNKDVKKPGYETQCDMNLHPYYKRVRHHHCYDEPQYHITNDDTYCDYWKPTEKDIVDVNGYNATNVRIMHQVSKRIADYTHVLELLNNLNRPLDLEYIQCRFPTIDSSLFRTVLSVAFTELLKKDIQLNRSLQEKLMLVDTPKEEKPEIPCDCKNEEKPSISCDCPTHPSYHRPEYTNYPKLSEEFVRKILKQIYQENNWEETEEKPKVVDPVGEPEDKPIPNPGKELVDLEGTEPTEGTGGTQPARRIEPPATDNLGTDLTNPENV